MVASATLSQTQVLANMPVKLTEMLPDMTDAQRAIQFTRSTPGIAAALVGMGRPEHVRENIGMAGAPPLSSEQYAGLYR